MMGAIRGARRRVAARGVSEGNSVPGNAWRSGAGGANAMTPLRVRFGLRLVSCAVGLTVALAAASGASEVSRLSDEGFILIDGEPRLVLGSYELPKEDSALRALAENGFNLVRGARDREVLDRIGRHGMYAWLPLGSSLALPEGDDARRQALTDVIEGLKDHPALLVWEGPDEALWLCWYAAFQWNTFEQPFALSSAIRAARDAHPAAKIAEWERLRDRAFDLIMRGLWAESEAIYDQLWKDLAGAHPQPDKTVTACIERARILGDDLTRGWEHIRSLDPSRVFWQNHAPRNSIEALRHHNRAVDAAGCDIYPMPANLGVIHGDLPNRSITCIGEYTERMQEGAPGKAVWMVLQGFGWKDFDDPYNPGDEVGGRRPTYEETRFMAYDAIVHGAKAVLYWGTGYIEKDSALWLDLLKVGRELRALEPGIVGQRPATEPSSVGDETYASVDNLGPKLMLRRAGNDWVLIAVNRTYPGLGFNVGGLPADLEGKTLHRLYADESVTVENGGFRDGMRGYDVHVYATSRRFEAE